MDRAAELAERNPWAREVLAFYSRILEFQRKICERTQVPDGTASADEPKFRMARHPPNRLGYEVPLTWRKPYGISLTW